MRKGLSISVLDWVVGIETGKLDEAVTSVVDCEELMLWVILRIAQYGLSSWVGASRCVEVSKLGAILSGVMTARLNGIRPVTSQARLLSSGVKVFLKTGAITSRKLDIFILVAVSRRIRASSSV